MNLANDIIIKKYRPNDDLLTSHAINSPYNDDIPLSQKKMDEFMCGSLPPTDLYFKIGCILMLLRNWRLSEGMKMLLRKNSQKFWGLANGTRLRLVNTGPKLRVIECEIITGPRYKPPIVIHLILENFFHELRKFRWLEKI